jgi:hypothetical protein
MPVGTENEICHLLRENRRSAIGSSHDHSHFQSRSIVFNNIYFEPSDFDKNVPSAQVAWKPSPAFKVQLNLTGAIHWRDIESC